MGTWVNDDGLVVKFNRDEATHAVVGEVSVTGDFREIVVLVDYSKLEAAGTTTILSDTVRIPDGVWLDSAQFVVETAFDSAGEAAELTFGTIRMDRSTAHDADGIDVAIAEASIDAAGDTIDCDGQLINTTLSVTNDEPVLLTALVGTEAFTAGRGYLTVRYRVKDPATLS